MKKTVTGFDVEAAQRAEARRMTKAQFKYEALTLLLAFEAGRDGHEGEAYVAEIAEHDPQLAELISKNYEALAATAAHIRASFDIPGSPGTPIPEDVIGPICRELSVELLDRLGITDALAANKKPQA